MSDIFLTSEARTLTPGRKAFEKLKAAVNNLLDLWRMELEIERLLLANAWSAFILLRRIYDS